MLLNDERILPDVLGALKRSIELNLQELRLANAERPIAAVAWLARNLLELVIWTEYCYQSQDHARQFLLDSARDACDMLDIPDGLLAAGFSFQDARQELITKAAEDGFDIDDPFTRVAAAARTLGRANFFKSLNKLLSKFAHPTALLVIRGNNGKEEELILLRKKYYDVGLSLGAAALRFIAQAGVGQL